MAHASSPTTRLLAVLELLQTHGRMSGPELARRLEVGERTVRRYVNMLVDLGIPVVAERGRYGAYRLRPGFKLPPLMFGESEAVALVLGLLAVRQTALAGSAVDVEGALTKVERVMPERLRARVRAVQEAVVLTGRPGAARPEASIIGLLSEAAYEGRRVRLRYRSRRSEETERGVDVYGIVCREGTWYAVGHDHLRAGLRTFRLDRVMHAELRDERFDRPSDFDAVAHVERALATMPGAITIEVLLETTVEEARSLVPPAAATLEETTRGVLARGQLDDARSLGRLAHTLAGIDRPMIVLRPPELRDELRKLALRTARLAERTTGGDGDRVGPPHDGPDQCGSKVRREE